MDAGDRTSLVLAVLAIMAGPYVIGYHLGRENSKVEALQKLQEDAVRNGKAEWVTGEGGKPKFAWKILLEGKQ